MLALHSAHNSLDNMELKEIQAEDLHAIGLAPGKEVDVPCENQQAIGPQAESSRNFLGRACSVRMIKSNDMRDSHTLKQRWWENPVPIYVSYSMLRALFAILLGLIYFQLLWTGAKLWSRRSVVPVGDEIKTIHIKTYPIQAFQPVDLQTGRCSIRLVHPCDDESQKCASQNVIGYGINTGFMGAGKTRSEVVGDKLFIVISAYQSWTFVFESWFNCVVCDLIVISRGKNIVIEGQYASIFAENITLPAANISGPGGTKDGEIWVQMKNVTVTQGLDIKATAGGILIEDLHPADRSHVALSIREGSIDVTTYNTPRTTVASLNQAVCLVGPGSNCSVTKEFDTSTNMTTVKTNFDCFDSGVTLVPGDQPTMYIEQTEPVGSVGLHVYGPTAILSPSLQSPIFVLAGKGFKAADGVNSSAWHISVDHTSLNDKSLGNQYAYIGIKGVGLMHGGLQLAFSKLSIWWFLEGEIQYFAMFSAFTVFPTISKDYTATISFCPAHGDYVKKELMTPIQAVMDGVHGQGNWMFRNRGGQRDAMMPLIKSKGLNFNDPAKNGGDGVDLYLPDCSYCSDFTMWVSSAYRGSFSLTNDPKRTWTGDCEGFPDPTACHSCRKSSAHNFAPIKAGADVCYPDAAISALMQPDVNKGVHINSKLSSKCLTSADLTCYIEGFNKGIPTTNVYASWKSFFILATSFIIAIISTAAVVASVIQEVLNKGRKQIITQYIIRDKKLLQLVQSTVLISQRFVIAQAAGVEHHGNYGFLRQEEQNVSDDHNLLTHDIDIIADYISLAKIDKQDRTFLLFKLLRWVSKNFVPDGVKRHLRKYGLFQRSGIKRKEPLPVTVSDFASTRFINKLAWISTLKVAEDGSITDENLHLWINQSNGLLLASTFRKKFVFYSSEEGHDNLVDWNAVIENPDMMVWSHTSSCETPAMLWKDFQKKVRQVKYVLQRLQIDVNVWFLLEKTAKPLPVDIPEPNPEEALPYFGTARKLYQESIHSLWGEVQTVFIFLAFTLTPALIVGLFALVLFQVRIMDLGISDLGNQSRTSVWTEGVFRPIVGIFLVVNALSALFYQARKRDWGVEQIRKSVLPQVFATWIYRVNHLMREEISKMSGRVVNDQWGAGDNSKLCEPGQVQKHNWAYFAQNDDSYTFYLHEKQFMHCIFTLQWGAVVFYIVLVAQWVLLGMFLSPNTLAPYATAIVAMAAHVIKIYSRKVAFYESAKLMLKEAIHLFKEDRKVKALQQLKALEMARSMEERWPDIHMHAKSFEPMLTSMTPRNFTSRAKETIKMKIPKIPIQDAGPDLEAIKNEAAHLMRTATEAIEETTTHELQAWLARYSVSMEIIIVEVTFSAVILLLIFIFLFFGMQGFTPKNPSTEQALINSFITGGSGYVLNTLTRGDVSMQKLQGLIARILEQYKREISSTSFSFSLDEDVVSMMQRAAEHVKNGVEDDST